MPKMIFVNLPVAGVAKSTAFHEAMGRPGTRDTAITQHPQWWFPTRSS